ncbi:MAG TPA: helix-turn-helix transcriptional regulator [Dehalococcoidia bacterium]|nr:helix-turn-helix transcriptional regulator [Dehalococcoidia bacterium]
MKLERLRRHREMTQAHLGEKTGVSQQYVAMLEKGERTPSLAMLKKLARALEVEVGELLE